MVDSITPEVAQGAILFAGEGTFENGCRLFPLTCVCLCCFDFTYLCVCLTCCLFTQPSMPRPAFGTRLGLVKLAHFPPFLLSFLCCVLPCLISHSPSPPPPPQPPPRSPIMALFNQQATHSQPSPCQTHTNTQSITNPKLALLQNEHRVWAVGTER